MNTEIKTTGDLRSFLAESLVMVRAGTVDPEVARNITRMAHQINENFNAEAKVARVGQALGRAVAETGKLELN
jgi:hypothetical protein